MLVLYETAAGYALFKVADKVKLEDRDMHQDFATPELANKVFEWVEKHVQELFLKK